MEVIITMINGLIDEVLLYKNEANAIRGYYEKAEELGVKFPEEDYSSFEIDKMIFEVEDQLSGSSKAIYWQESDIIDK